MENLLKSLLIIAVVLNPMLPKLKVAQQSVSLYVFILLLILLIYLIKLTINQNKYVITEKLPIFISLTTLFGLIVIGSLAINNTIWAKIMLNEIMLLFIYLGFIITFLFNDKYTVKYVLYTIYGLNLFFIAFGYYEILTDKHLPIINFTDYINDKIYIKFATGVFYNPNNLSVFLLLGYMITYSYIKSNTVKFVHFILIFYIFYINDSKICLFLSLVFIIFMAVTILKNAMIRVSIILFGFVVTFLIIPFLNQSSNVIDIMQSDTLKIRVELIKEGLRLANVRPSGYGPSMFNKIFNGSVSTNGVRDPHSIFIEILVNYGYLGFLFFIIFYIILCYQAWSLGKQREELRSIFSGLIITIGLFFVMSTSFKFEFFWLLFAIVIGLNNYYKNKYNMKKEGVFNE